jgi:hypothetical protein
VPGDVRLDVVLGDLAAAARPADFLEVDVSLGGDTARQRGRAGAVALLGPLSYEGRGA